MIKRDAQYSILVAILLIGFGLVLVRNACIIEDAYITFRTIDNLTNGYGLRWNPIERVQTYTHPLWMMVMAVCYFLCRDIYFSCTIVSITLTLFTLLIFAGRIVRFPLQIIPVFLGLSLSKAFIDYSTAGLENPLTHFLLTLFVAVLLSERELDSRKLFLISLLAALITLNRMDALLLLLPVLIYYLLKLHNLKTVGVMGLGFTPFFVWELFSLFYYGMPFPNTAYAKLNTSISALELLQQGFYYGLNSLSLDPITIFTIVIGCVLALMERRREELLIVIGIAVHTMYVLKIGGCFMSGRFFAAPLLLALVPLARSHLSNLNLTLLCLMLSVIGLSAPRNPWLSDATYGQNERTAINYAPQNDTRVLDERGTYYELSGLLNYKRTPIWPASIWAMEGVKARERSGGVEWRYNSGYFGYFAGPGVHVIEYHGLCDPLLARLPAMKKYNWIIGHFARPIPGGYANSLAQRKNLLTDPKLAEFYDEILLITRGDLFSLKRCVAIIKLNLGIYNHLIDNSSYRDAALKHSKLSGIVASTPSDKTSKTHGIAFDDYGIAIEFDSLSHAARYQIGLWGMEVYWIEYLLNNEVISKGVAASGNLNAPVSRIELTLIPPVKAVERGITEIRIYPCYRYMQESILYYVSVSETSSGGD